MNENMKKRKNKHADRAASRWGRRVYRMTNRAVTTDGTYRLSGKQRAGKPTESARSFKWTCSATSEPTASVLNVEGLFQEPNFVSTVKNPFKLGQNHDICDRDTKVRKKKEESPPVAQSMYFR
jgi:hypothetical protein